MCWFLLEVKGQIETQLQLLILSSMQIKKSWTSVTRCGCKSECINILTWLLIKLVSCLVFAEKSSHVWPSLHLQDRLRQQTRFTLPPPRVIRQAVTANAGMLRAEVALWHPRASQDWITACCWRGANSSSLGETQEGRTWGDERRRDVTTEG